jgi:hypothetical protein
MRVLTIIEKISKSIDMEEYIMGYPNRDVRYSFLNHLLEEFSPECAGSPVLGVEFFCEENGKIS